MTDDWGCEEDDNEDKAEERETKLSYVGSDEATTFESPFGKKSNSSSTISSGCKDFLAGMGGGKEEGS